MDRYNRNRIYVRENEQKIIKDTKILLGGAGIGSIIAECALRFGFENITIIDYDKVELSNLNRQNYTEGDLGKYKAEMLAKRLLSINSNAKITVHNCFVDNDNVESFVKVCDVAINALDFNSDIPFVFDNVCKKYNVPVLHPYNLGWAGFLSVVMPDGIQLSQLSENLHQFELCIAEYVFKYSKFWNISNNEWLEKVLREYKNEDNILPPPQLSVASWIVAGLCTNVIYNLVTGKEVKVFPKFYISTIYNDSF
jgi:molybdopterin/thiamine biosynthesis adenylyltransferase